MAAAPTHALVAWEDGYVTVISLSTIAEPRKSLDMYVEGELITAPFRGQKGMWKAQICEISGLYPL